MITAVFSDVHGNLPALQKFVAATRDVAGAYVSLGDIVNYGPWNDECLELARSLPNITFLEGNHERMFLGTEPIDHELALVQDFFHASKRGFTKPELITGLALECRLGQFVCTHTINNRRIYKDTQIEVANDYIIGHTHHAFDVERSGHRVINCGSVGQNRGRITRLSYALHDSQNDRVTLHEMEYDVEPLFREFARRNYPPQCVEYYRKKMAAVW